MIPQNYKWLLQEPGPKMIVEALKTVGVKEMPGTGDNPEILEWAAETGLDRVYSDDAIPWCGLWMALIAQRAGKDIPDKPLWALNWRNFGNPVDIAMLGDVLVFKRPQGGHVGLYVGEDKTTYRVLGGNQSDAVGFTRITKERCVGIRRPIYSVGQPPNVRRIYLTPSGTISTNEK